MAELTYQRLRLVASHKCWVNLSNVLEGAAGNMLSVTKNKPMSQINGGLELISGNFDD